jgi:hypothetical protein
MKAEQIGLIGLIIIAYGFYILFLWGGIPLNFLEICGLMFLGIGVWSAWFRERNKGKWNGN